MEMIITKTTLSALYFAIANEIIAHNDGQSNEMLLLAKESAVLSLTALL